MAKQTYQRHWFEEDGPEYPIEVAILKDWVTLSIDTSGPGLHKRGYRPEVAAAPLRETTAAALVLAGHSHGQLRMGATHRPEVLTAAIS